MSTLNQMVYRTKSDLTAFCLAWCSCFCMDISTLITSVPSKLSKFTSPVFPVPLFQLKRVQKCKWSLGLAHGTRVLIV